MNHELRDEISLELGRRVALALREEPGRLGVAHANLARWIRLNANVPSLLRCYREWEEILKRPLDEVCLLLTAENEEARRLRQNSPFAGILSPAEVWEVKRRVRDANNAA